MTKLANGPDNLPWSKNAYLLFNGVTLAHPMRRILSWNPSPVYKPLFLQTRFSGLLEKSPVLVQIKGRRDPVYTPFLENAHLEWGLLLFSEADHPTVLAHLRWLVTVDQPVGKAVLLNLSDPATANALFGLYPAHTDNRLFGPIDEIYAAEVVTETWIRHVRQGAVIAHDPKVLYRLTETQIEALDEVSFRLNVIDLDKHMARFFPDYLPCASPKERFERLYELARHAYEAGFRTKADIFHYANTSHFLSTQPPGAHPEIVEVIRNKSGLTPSQRIKQANWLVVERDRAQNGAQS
ncbi:DUF4123 domain-containing protein [Pseudomonas sp. v388]|uniref:DUF4123 domain-containing protein n=1 Tax=Pseudomonas sp. v388 TaxID=2479849 RepID=UPI000F7853FA|nr:DUF4123 domain-containing protein [Pseudomonas sp. v388]RRV05984.1 DUF4123 domain-containing protein [Pseudomonas sp. v388]